MVKIENFYVTRRQSEAISALISYPNQEKASEALGIKHASFRMLIQRARRDTGCETNEQLVHYWTVQQVTQYLAKQF